MLPVDDADVVVPKFASRSWRKVCRAVLLLDVLFVLAEALCVLRVLFVEPVEAAEELAPNS
jgi:hypothetical protein